MNRVGDKVTVLTAPGDPYVLQFQRHVRVAAWVDGGCMVTLDGVRGGEPLGPIPDGRVRDGWRDGNGRWR